MTQPSNATFITWRFTLILTAIFLFALILIFRIIDLSVFNQFFLKHEGDERVMRLVSAPSFRGFILDRNGNPLAVSTEVFSIWTNPKELPKRLKVIDPLCKQVGLNAADVKKMIISKQDKEFVYIKRGITPQQADKIRQLKIPGIYLQKEFRRFYPEGEVTAHLIGFTNVDDKGQEGIELAYDDWLKGKPGKKWVIKDRLGRIVSDVETIQDQVPGKNIFLSIDKRIQYLAYRELLKGILENKAESGSVVIMDTQTGEVLAIVNYPSFNPNKRPVLINNALRNRAITDTFEPGSTIKAFSIASVLEEGQYDIDSVINTYPGWIRFGKNLVRDERNNGELSISQIVQKSSNVGIARLVENLPPQNLVTLLNRVGFGELSGIYFPGEQSGTLFKRYQPGSFSFATLAFGYGISTTTLQLARTYMTIANHGVKLPASLLRLTKNPQGEAVLSPDLSNKILLLLESVVKAGTGEKGRIPGFRVAGKTGTSHLVGKYGYEKNKYTSSFVGIAPVSNPRFVVAVVISDPKGKNYLGGKVAGPIFERIMEGTLRLMDIPPDAENII